MRMATRRIVAERLLQQHDKMTRTCLLSNMASPWPASCDAAGPTMPQLPRGLPVPRPKVPPAALNLLRSLPPIPRRVHVAWRSSVVPPPSLFSSLTIRVLIQRNPGWEVRIHNDSEIDAYLQSSLPSYDPAAYAEIAHRHIVEKVALQIANSLTHVRTCVLTYVLTYLLPRRWTYGDW